MEGSRKLTAVSSITLILRENIFIVFSLQERIVAKCLENKIAVYSPHTTFDSVRGGVNDWLADAFENGKFKTN